ncbi:hypothetical protein NVP1031O_138 [Vibrio phage 1.031.O._10N.261.46.F8]|nr:hypothetical protein NVP1031O_138 [Vibrio phage 1.031.O._10N.261.46.F8]
MSGVLVQGDKTNSIRCQTAYKFDESNKNQPKNSTNIRLGAAQYCVDIYDISGSPKLVIDSFNAEDWTGEMVKVTDTFKAKLDIRCPNVIPANAGAKIFGFYGVIQPTTEIWMRSLGSSDSVDVTPTHKFMLDGTGLAPNGIFYMEYDLYNRVISQCDPLSRQMIRVADYNSHTGGSAIFLSGQTEYRVPFSNLDSLYSNFFVYDFANSRLSTTGTGWQFGNGLTFRISGSEAGGGALNIAQFSIRSQSPTAFTSVDITGDTAVTADFITSELVITSLTTSKSFTITPS